MTYKGKKRKLIGPPGLSIERKLGFRPLLRRFLVVCEGKNTEISYFKKFRIPTLKVEPVGTGLSTVKLVKKVASIKNRIEHEKHISFNSVWVVFDKDNNNDFCDAIKLARHLGYNVAYSVQAFEYWFILHFKDHQGGPMERSSYVDQINDWLSSYHTMYDPKSKIVELPMFNLLFANIQQAYDRSTRLYNKKHAKQNDIEESVTTVHKLVGDILSLKPSSK
jgi:hypothetical protein